MLSLDAATVGSDGYRELFQVGEVFNGQPIIDRQHPHDFFMQTAASWRTTCRRRRASRSREHQSGSPALGPVAFMHRASAFDNPMAPLSHHTFDSTHVSFGVVTGGVSTGRGRSRARCSTAANRTNTGGTSTSARLIRSRDVCGSSRTPSGRFRSRQVISSSRSRLEPGNIERTTASASWTRTRGREVSSVTAGYGRNDTSHGDRQAVFLEGARHTGRHTLYARLEVLQPEFAETNSPLTTFTVGGVRNVFTGSGLAGGFGGGVTFHFPPAELEPDYGPHPVSFQVFFRLRRAAPMMKMP